MSIWYVNATMSVLFLPPVVPCMLMELSAVGGERIYFDLDGNGMAKSFTIPGLSWGIKYTRV